MRYPVEVPTGEIGTVLAAIQACRECGIRRKLQLARSADKHRACHRQTLTSASPSLPGPLPRMKSMRALVPILILGSSACATVAGVRRQPLDRGMLTYYPRPAEATIEAACRALQGERATLKGVDRRDSATVVLGTRGGSFLGSGEIVRVVITSPSLDTSAVRVVSRTNFTPMANPTAALFGFDRGVAVAA